MAEKKDTGYSLALGWALLIGVVIILGYVVWLNNRYEIMDAIRWWRWAYLQPLLWVLPNDWSVMTDQAGASVTLAQFEQLVETNTKATLSPPLVGLISDVTLAYYRPVLSVLLLLMILWTIFYGPGTQYRRKYDMNGLLQFQRRSFPYVAPVADFDPTKQPFRPPGAPVPADLPSFAEALSPEEWIAFHTIPTLTDRQIDRAAATRAFAKQLGRPWRGWKNLPAYRQVLLAGFALRAVRKRKESDDMIGRMALCWQKGVLKIDGKLLRAARAVLRNDKISEKILSKCNMHAFETTAMIRALATAREEGGVLAPATFVWLRGYDRALWYPLNNLGRQAFHMEALGAMGHYKSEKLIDRPIVRPKVEGAVEALEGYMKSLKARPVPQLDYSNSKRRAIKKVGAA